MVEDVQVFAFDQQKNSGLQLKSRQIFVTFLRCLSHNNDSDTIMSGLTNLRIMVDSIQILNLSQIR